MQINSVMHACMHMYMDGLCRYGEKLKPVIDWSDPNLPTYLTYLQ